MTFAIAILLGAPAVRLLDRAVRDRLAPELFAGLFFAGAGIGIPLRIVGAARALESPEAGYWLNASGHLLFAGGSIALYLFTRHVFRPDSRAARIACAVGIAAVAASTGAVFATGAVSDETSVAVLCTNLARLAAPGWAFAESLRYYRMMRRRVRLGIGDPVVTDRFRLWALWTGALAMAPLLAASARIAGRLLAHDEASSVSLYAPTVIAIVRLALLAAVPLAIYGIAMSFFAPSRYLERIRRRAAAAAP